MHGVGFEPTKALPNGLKPFCVNRLHIRTDSYINSCNIFILGCWDRTSDIAISYKTTTVANSTTELNRDNIFIFFYFIFYLGSLGLDKVGLQVSLEVKISELITSRELEKSAELGIGVDLATIGLVLKVVGADVAVDLTADIGSGHLSTSGLAEEGGELRADHGGANKARGLAVARALVLAVGNLLGGLVGLDDGLLESLELSLEGGNIGVDLRDLGTVAVKKLQKIVSDNLLNWGSGLLSRSGNLLDRSGGGLLDGGGLGNSLLCGGGGGLLGLSHLNGGRDSGNRS